MFILIVLLLKSLFALCIAENPYSTLPVLIPTQLDLENNYRLPNNTLPLHYEVHLITNIHKEDFDFEGRVTITLQALDDTNNITIHYRQLQVNDVILIDAKTGKVLQFEEPTYDEVTEHYVIPLEKPLVNGSEYQLTIEYNATLRTDLAGFHRSSYKDEEGKLIWQAGTHFEPHNARHAFPCYDEPGLRATFDISITHDKSYHAVSNMPVKEIKPEANDMVTTVFVRTLKVQTYLIAFVVSDFASVSFDKTDGISYQLYARPEAIRNGDGDFGLLAGEKILTNQEKYFQTKYSLPKMSQIAMPDFGAGAMENWGIVIYAQSLLLYDQSSAEVEERHGVGHIIGHEFAHQWFGDLVAPKWWSYLWLNEGFATLYAAHTMSLVYPEYRDIDLFILNNLQHAMRVDATGTTRPMTFYVENPRGISNLFDDISYSKAGSVLRMFQHALTEETWRNGLKYYLDEMKHEAADSDDLARGLQKAADEDKRLPSNVTMKAVIDSWSHKGGFPIITVNRTEENVLVVSQTKYVQSKGNRAPDLWLIPINFASASHSNFTNTAPVVWMHLETLTLNNKTFYPFGENDWVIFNIQETGYYRVNYADELWHLIADKLTTDTFEDIHVINRAQIVDDVLTLAKNDLVAYEIVFKIMEYLERETDFLPWAAANNGLGYINRLMTGSDHYLNFQKYVARLVGPLYQTLGSHDRGTKDDLSDKRARSIAINWACLSGEESCIKDTTNRVTEVLEDPSAEIEANVRSAIYRNGLRKATQPTFDAVQKRFSETSDTTARRTLISGMGCIEDQTLQKQNLELTLQSTKDSYTQQERTRVLQSIYNSGGRNGVDSSIDFLREHHGKVDELYGKEIVRNSMYGMADKVTSKAVVDKFEELIDVLVEANVLESKEKDVLLEQPKLNLEWLENNDNEIGVYFKEYFENGASSSAVASIILMFVGVVVNFLIKH